jgi:uncharacterized protein YdeI (YjbR/CyaY-like superfamily)
MMGRRDPRIDAYIAAAAPFARPILTRFRGAVHAACPDVTETMKWNIPHFDYKGIMAAMAAFKKHCVVGFWKARLMSDPDRLFESPGSKSAMGQLGRLSSVDALPTKRVLVKYVREAMALNDSGIKITRPARPRSRRRIAVPHVLKLALSANARARKTFEQFTPGHKREYIEWITEAKTEETRRRRLETAIAWMEEGKPRNWKYMRGPARKGGSRGNARAASRRPG